MMLHECATKFLCNAYLCNFRMIRQANAKYINRFVRQASASTTIPIPTKPVYRDLDPGW